MITIQRSHRDPWLPQEVPTWRALRRGNTLSATFVCPNGHEWRLTAHQIAGDGVVTPSVICPVCPFHDYIRLEGWSDG